MSVGQSGYLWYRRSVLCRMTSHPVKLLGILPLDMSPCITCSCRDAEEVAARLGGIPPDLPSRGGLALLQVPSKP